MPNEDEVEFHRGQVERAAAQLRSEPPSTLFEEWALAATSAPDDVVVSPRDADYAVPEHFAKTVPGPALHELRRLLAELRELREQLVGLSTTELLVMYNGHDLAMLLEQEFVRWTIAHIERRLARPSPKDRGRKILSWDRLMDEFGWWFEALGVQRGSGHNMVLNQNLRRLPWELFQRTWAPHFKASSTWGEFSIEGLPPMEAAQARHTAELFNWGAVGLAEHLMRETPGLASGVAGDLDRWRSELRVMAADLVEVKSLLVRGYVAQDHAVELPDGLTATWEWELGHQAGSVTVSRAPGGPDGWLGVVLVGLDGRPADGLTPWIDLGDAALPWAVGLLRPIHAALVDAWSRVERRSATAPEPLDALAEGELVAAACEVMAAEDTATPETGVARTGSTPRVPAVRTITLLALLERRLGCEVRQGKGSEITVYRPGGRKYTLPGHRRNVHFPAHIVRAMLKAVGISPAEFAAAARIG